MSLSRWLQFPKDFKKIASYLRNKTTRDCVRFYYDSKQSVFYKGALKEHLLRRKRRGTVWDATVDAAMSVGAIIKKGTSEDKPLVFMLPESDNTFTTRNFHPMQREVYDAMLVDKSSVLVDDKRAAIASKARTPIFVLDAERSKFLQRDDSADEDELEATGAKATPHRKSSGKWTSEEKRIFSETLEKHGQNWDVLAEAVKTKTRNQIKNHFYDTRKPKGRPEKRRKRQRDEVATPPPSATPTGSALSTPIAEAVPPRMESSLRHHDPPTSFDAMQYHRLRQQEQQQQQHPLLGDMYALNRQRQQEMDQRNSRTSTPDPMDLASWAQHQSLYQQSEEAARRLLQSHAQQQQLMNLQRQQLLLQHLQQQQQHQHHQHHQQQQQQHQHQSNLAAALGLSSGYGGVQDDHHALAQLLLRQQQQGAGSSDEAALQDYLRRLNQGGGQGGGQR